MAGRTHSTAEVRKAVRAYYERGRPLAWISEKTGYSERSVRLWAARENWMRETSFPRAKPSGKSSAKSKLPGSAPSGKHEKKRLAKKPEAIALQGTLRQKEMLIEAQQDQIEGLRNVHQKVRMLADSLADMVGELGPELKRRVLEAVRENKMNWQEVGAVMASAVKVMRELAPLHPDMQPGAAPAHGGPGAGKGASDEAKAIVDALVPHYNEEPPLADPEAEAEKQRKIAEKRAIMATMFPTYFQNPSPAGRYLEDGRDGSEGRVIDVEPAE